jgi:hypothetical protein
MQRRNGQTKEKAMTATENKTIWAIERYTTWAGEGAFQVLIAAYRTEAEAEAARPDTIKGIYGDVRHRVVACEPSPWLRRQLSKGATLGEAEASHSKVGMCVHASDGQLLAVSEGAYSAGWNWRTQNLTAKDERYIIATLMVDKDD